MSKKVVDDSLRYQSKAVVYDRNLGRNILIDVTKSFARSQERGGPMTFPSGLMKFIRTKANEFGFDCDIEYVEPYVLKRKLVPSLPGITFEPFQAKMLRRVGIHKRGILVGPTAMGKSVVLGGIVDKLHCPVTVIIVPNQTIFNQLYDHFCNWFGKEKVGRIGQGIFDQRHITICLYQSISKYVTAKSGLKLILVDEVHLINNTIIRFFRRCNNIYYRYGVTATPQKPEKDFVKAMQMQGFIGPIICEVTDDEASSRVLPVKVNLISFFCGKTTGTDYQSVLRNDILLSDLRNAKLIKAAVDQALNKGLTCLFLIDETKQGEKIMEIAAKMNIDMTLVHGKQSSARIKQVIKDLNSRVIQCVVATKVFGVGTDIPNVDCVVMASSRKSEIDTLQKIGRGRRRIKGSDHLIVIDSIDKVRGKRFTQHFYTHSLERLQIYKEKNWEINRLTF
jgi:superfamily II DNA or RNA helicase